MQFFEWYFTDEYGYVGWKDGDGWIGHFIASKLALDTLIGKYGIVVEERMLEDAALLPPISHEETITYRGHTAHALTDFLSRASRLQRAHPNTKLKVVVPTPCIVDTGIFRDAGVSEGFTAAVDATGFYHFDIFFSKRQALEVQARTDWPIGQKAAKRAHRAAIEADPNLSSHASRPSVSLPPKLAQWVVLSIFLAKRDSAERSHLS